MMYEDLVADFADRTLKNLRFIEQTAHSEDSVYEVTQLINSMLGLLVFPRESFVNRVPDTPLETLQQHGWPVVRSTAHFKQAKTLRELVRYLRNAITHFHLEFLADDRSQICGVKLWNINRSRQRDWEIEIYLDQLREITCRFIELLKDEELIRAKVRGTREG